MSWLAAMAVLHTHVHQNYLAKFNIEAQKFDSKWKDAKTTDDLALMNESKFLERLQSLSIIGKNVKKELTNALDTRNGCGHPSSLQVSTNQAAAHLEFLLQNVFNKFQIA